jgi:hypothetical protein
MADPGARTVQEILQEVSRLQQIGAKLPAGMTWTQFAAKSLAGNNILGRIGQIGSKLTSLPADVLRDIKVTAILALLGVEGENIIQRLITERRIDLNPVPQWLEPAIGALVRGSSEAIGAPLFDLMIKEPLGLDLSDIPGHEDAAAVRVLQRLFGFGVMLDFATAEPRDLLKPLFGDNAPTGLVDAIRNIPQSVGVQWATGFVLSQFLWESYMPPLVERANRQTRPKRLSPDALITLQQRELISEAEANSAMADAGYRDRDMQHMRSLAEARLSMSDLTQAFQYELRDQSFVETYLRRSGFTAEDAALWMQVNLERAETAGGDQLRAVAQRGFMDGHLTEDQYYSYLRTVNVPATSARLEVEAAKLAKTWQVKNLSVAQIKTLHDKNLINDAQAIARLVAQDFTEENALELVNSWKETAAAPHAGLTESMILGYLVSGVLTKTEAFDRLVTQNIKPEDAAFLVEHPSTTGPVKSHGAAVGTIVGALKDGVIDVVTAEQKLRDTGMDADAVALTIREASFQITRGKTPKQPHKDLSAAQILDAFRYGLATSAWAVRELVQTGYTQTDATLIVAIEETKLSERGEPPADWVTLQ